MCGIAGYYYPGDVFSRADLESMSRSLMHRGPDAEGIFIENCTGLAHRRLSIIDLSSAAHQPMHSHCGRYVIVFNGEVYNFREIQKDIEKETGLKFRTHSDTEVVLEAFAAWGSECVHRFNGMFAFAVYDKHSGAIHLMRDRVGIKPLFIYQDDKGIVFASEIKSILSSEYIRKRLTLSHESLTEYLHLGYIPEPHTAWNEIRKFPSGCRAVHDKNGLHITSYWMPEACLTPATINDEQDALTRFNELFRDAVRLRLVSDVPFGTFLSGGVDSSLVTAVAQSVHSSPLNTFTIGFENADFDESSFARSVSERLGTHHHEFTVTENDAIKIIPGLTEIFDEPFADSSAIPTLLVSAMARKHVTMTLSGDGGDELFMGYGAYRWARRLDNPVWDLMRKPLGSILKRGTGRQQRIGDMLKHENTNLHSHIFSQEQYLFSASEIRSLLTEPADFYGIPFTPPDHVRHPGPAEQQAFFDLRYYLKDDLLVKVDRASMHHSLENRVPLLDYRIVELSLNIEEGLKIKGKQSKYLLKKLLFSYLPEALFQRPKRGFAVPLRKWLKGPLKEWMMDSIAEAEILKYNVVKFSKVNDLVSRYLHTDSEYLYNRIWSLIMLHDFLRKSRDAE